MSIETWKQEFFEADFQQERQCQQSLKKWIGLRKENLEKHKCAREWNTILDVQRKGIRITAGTCSLCHFNYETDELDECEGCPLYKHLGVSCDACSTSPYSFWLLSSDPEPMIKALTIIAEKEIKNAAKKSEKA